jgi:hypothetical protein
MKINASTAKNYKPSYKKKTITTDPYLPRGASKKVSVCERCHAVYSNKRWSIEPERYDMLMQDPAVTLLVCPACHKIQDDIPGGIVTLKGDYVLPHKQELLNLVKNEEKQARGDNPLERVMSVKENGKGSLVITTTNERLAQRLGRAIKKAFHGEVAYHFSHDNKLARVDWERAV